MQQINSKWKKYKTLCNTMIFSKILYKLAMAISTRLNEGETGDGAVFSCQPDSWLNMSRLSLLILRYIKIQNILVKYKLF